MRRSSPVAAIGAVVALLLTGCADAAPDAGSEPSSPTSATPSASSPTASASPSPNAVPVTCETLLDDADEAQYAAAGWTFSSDYIERATAQQFPTLSFVAYGGVLCQIGLQGTDADHIYAYSPITPAQATAERARLTDEGYTSTSDLGGTLFEGHGDVDQGEYADLFYLVLDDSWFHTTVNRDAVERAVRNVEAL